MESSKQVGVALEANSSLLSVMIGKHEAIEQAVSLIKKELTPEMISEQQSATNKGSAQQKSHEEFNGLTTLLEDSSIQSAIKNVAGEETRDIIGKALVALKSSESVDDKSKVFSEGIKKLHANLSQSDKSKLHKDPLFNLAIGLVGLGQNRRI